MKKMQNVKASLLAKGLLTPAQMRLIKGGIDASTTITTLLDDDKRRGRPGGGVSTQ